MLAQESLRRQSTDSSLSRTSSSTGRWRNWNEDTQATWKAPVAQAETFHERVNRYSGYLSLTDLQVRNLYKTILEDLENGCQNRSRMVAGGDPNRSKLLKMLDTCVEKLPSGNEKGTAYALHFQGTAVRAMRCKFEGSHSVTTSEHRLSLHEVRTGFPKGLMDRKCGAMALFDNLASCVVNLVERSGDKDRAADTPLGFSLAFSLETQSEKTSTLMKFTRGFQTGRDTSDPVEGLDVGTLLDMAFWRARCAVKTTAVCNDAVSTLLACAYEVPPSLPPCTVAFLVGLGLNGAYVEPNWRRYGFKGCIINTEMGNFDAGLPIMDIDLEIDYADQSLMGGRIGDQMLEKMAAGAYLGEICRRLVVKVWREDAPPLAWARQSMPTSAAALIVADEDENLILVDKILKGLWEWETNVDCRMTLRKLFALVFERSAGLAAAAIAALAKRSGRLQPAMGGVTVAVDSSLHLTHTWYTDDIRKFLVQVLGEDSAALVHLYMLSDAPAKGAALFARMVASS